MKKTDGGITLLELIIAITVLITVMVPMFNVFYHSSRNNVLAYHIKTAQLIAQQSLEEFVGLRISFAYDEGVAVIDVDGDDYINQVKSFIESKYGDDNSRTDGYYTVVVEADPPVYLSDAELRGMSGGTLPLVEITVSVLSADDKELCVQSVLINAQHYDS